MSWVLGVCNSLSSTPPSARLTEKPSFVSSPFVRWALQPTVSRGVIIRAGFLRTYLVFSCRPVEDQKEMPSPVNPELRHKEVQMNFFNQLTSVFNPDITVLSSPSAHMQVSKLHTQKDQVCISIWILFAKILYIFLEKCLPFCIIGRGWNWWPSDDRSGCTGQNEECLHLSKCVQFTRIRFVFSKA